MRTFREMEERFGKAGEPMPRKQQRKQKQQLTEDNKMTQKQQIEQLQQETQELRTENTAIVEFMYTLLERIEEMETTIEVILNTVTEQK